MNTNNNDARGARGRKRGRKPTLESMAITLTVKVVPPVGWSPQHVMDEITSNIESVNGIVLALALGDDARGSGGGK